PLGRMQGYTVKMPGGTDEVYNYKYQDNGKTLVITDSLNRSWTTKKNDFGQVYYEKDPAGNYTNYYYEDGRGNLTKKIESEIDPEGNIKTYKTEYTYNAFNKLEEIKEWLEGDESTPPVITTFTYDAAGNLIGTKDGEKNIVTHQYDSVGRKLWTEQYLANGEKIKTSYEYYSNNLPWKIIDHKGNATEYKYDDQKRLTKVIYPDDTTLEYTYTQKIEDDNKYNMIIEKQRNGTVVTTIFDEMNRVKTRSIEHGPGVEGVTLESYGYDGLSRLTHAENNYSTVDMKYDPVNRLIEEKQNGKVVVYSYGVENNLRKMTMTYPNQRIIEKDFDILDRLSKIKQGQEKIADYSYIGRSYRVLSQQLGNGDVVSYLYDQGRRLTSEETKSKNSALINKYNYGYNKVHMKKYEQRGHDSNKGDIFAYDAIYRLTGIKFNSPEPTNPASEQFEKQKTVTFDKLSNILSIAENIDEQTQTVTTDIPADSTYSKLNQYARFDQWGLTYDLNGNLTQKGTQHYIHDYRNRIVRAADGSSTVNLKYDALGRRIKKEVSIGSQNKTTNFYYSGHQVIEVRDENDHMLRQYIYGNGIDEVIRVDKYNGTASTPYYLHRNRIGSTTAVTDANGNIVERVYYDIYGMPTFKDAAGNVIKKSSIGNNILFQGREYDYELNLYYYRARYYDPIMGRFLSTDPMGYADSMNLYQGFNMNPANFVDPFGERIKFTGDQKERDFEIFKMIFKKIGIQSIDSLIELDEEGYVILKKGKGSLIKYGKKVGRNLKRRDEGGYEAWIKYGTKNLKNYINFYKMSLEALFEEIINDPRTIEFQINLDKFKEKGFIAGRIGQGIFLHPDDDLNFSKDKNAQVVTEGIGGKDVHRKIFMDPYTTIVHEFGHAYGYMKGFYHRTNHESLFAELAVMFENLYRMRSGTLDENKSIKLRAHHNTRLNRNLTSWFFMIKGVGVWPKMK
ncbi:RHS repeat domain-containing protein, partial [Acidobacteriota bacterium]